jgi:hypothetical protein
LRLFNSDSNSRSDFEGFYPADIQLKNKNILVKVPIDDFVLDNDRDFPIDLDLSSENLN